MGRPRRLRRPLQLGRRQLPPPRRPRSRPLRPLRLHQPRLSVSTELADPYRPTLLYDRLWTVEFQLVPADPAVDPLHSGPALPVRLEGQNYALEFRFDDSNSLSAAVQPLAGTNLFRQTAYYVYTTNAVGDDDGWNKDEYSEIAWTSPDGLFAMECGFYGTNGPSAFPTNWTFTSLTDPPDFSGEGWVLSLDSLGDDGTPEPNIYDTQIAAKVPDGDPVVTVLATLPAGKDALVAVVCDSFTPTALVLDPDGNLLARKPLDAPSGGFRLGNIESVALGGGFLGEIGELRVWSGDARTADQLHAKREFVSPTSAGLALYLRTLAPRATAAFVDDANPGVSWSVSSGSWTPMSESGMSLSFQDEGLKRIDRGSIPALAALASLVPDIQMKLDRLDAGLNPLGLSSGAIPFDLSPVTGGDENRTHFEQIRERAGTALANARRILDRAQTAGNRLRLIQEAQVAKDELLDRTEQDFKHRLIEYFGYPYEGDIGPSGTYVQGYDGPDLVHYAWMDLADYAVTSVADTCCVTTLVVKGATSIAAAGQDIIGMDKTVNTNVYTFELSANGFILKPSNITGKRRAQGHIQEALGDFLCAYSSFTRAMDDYDYAYTQLEYELNAISAHIAAYTIRTVYADAKAVAETVLNESRCSTKVGINCLEFLSKLTGEVQTEIINSTPKIVGAG